MIRLFVIDADPEVRNSITAMLETVADIKVVGEFGLAPDLPAAVEKVKPHVVLLDARAMDMGMEQLPADIQATSSRPALIMTSEGSHPSVFRRSLMLGARDHLVKPFSAPELAETVAKVFEASGAGLASKARTIGFLGCKGGAGNTTVTLALAGAAVKKGLRTVVVDGNLTLGDVSFLLDTSTDVTWIDWSKDSLRGDPDPRKYLVRSQEGIDVLAAPPNPAQSELVKTEAVGRMFTALRDTCDLVLVDLPNNFNEMTLELLEGVEELYLVSEPDLAGIKNLRLIWELLEQLRLPHEKRTVLLNRVQKKDRPLLKETGKNFPFLVSLPLEGDLEKGWLHGQTPIRTSPRSAFSKQVCCFLDKILQQKGGE